MKRALVLASVALAAAAWGASAARRPVERPEPHGAPPPAVAPPLPPSAPNARPPRAQGSGYGSPFIFGAPVVRNNARPRIEAARLQGPPRAARPEPVEPFLEVAISGDLSGPKPHTFNYHGRTLQARQGGLYSYPIGYVAQHWRPGQSLPLEFVEPAFYYLDWQDLGLPPPPQGCRWVRYGHDIFLVNIMTGEIRDTAYDAIL